MTTIEAAKAMIRQQVAADLGEKLALLRKAKPSLSYQEAWQALQEEEPSLFAYANQVESDRWPTVPKVPPYRFVDTTTSTARESTLREALGLPSKVEARRKLKEGDPGVMLVYAADGTVAGLELVRGDHQERRIAEESQKLMDANPGMTRMTALELLRTKRPDLFPGESPRDLARKDEVMAKQEKIKQEVAKLRAVQPHLSFTLAWHRLQQERPELFDFAEP